MDTELLAQGGRWLLIGLALLAILAVDIVLWRRKTPLWARILIAMVVGVAVGATSPELTSIVKPIGDLFISLIRMMIVPLIFVTLVAGVCALGDPSKLGSIGAKTIALYLVTTWAAVALGIALGELLQPGVGVPLEAAAATDIATISNRLESANAAAKGPLEQLLGIVPTNPLQAMVEGDVLSIIFFAILTGVGILMAKDAGKPAADFFQSASESVLKMTALVMEAAPVGVVGLMAAMMAQHGFTVFDKLLRLAAGMYAGGLLHMIVIYGGLLILVLARYPIMRFFRGIVSAQAVAFSTSSSNATLPATLKATTENLGVSRSVASAVLPLGATVNMDGTALYLGLITVMCAQALGMELDWAQYGMIMLTATLASIGTAGIPSASLFLATMVMGSVGIPLEKAIMLVAFIFPFDRPLDMMRTVVNVTGDAAAAVTVARWEGELDVDGARAGKAAPVSTSPAQGPTSRP
jgi:Na+/H+-dicarboxylate symporter